MKQLKHLLTFILPGMLLCGCSEEFGQVTSQESMSLGSNSLVTDNEAKTDITLNLITEHDWVLDAILSATGSEEVDWVTVYEQEGSGNSTVTLSCKRNETTADRSAYVRFKIKGAYPEYRTCTLTQTGTPVVTTGTIAGATAESITLSGSYVYTGEYVAKTGFEIWSAENPDAPQSVYCETPGSEFSAVCPVEYGNDYSYKAFIEGKDGKRFLAANTENVSVRFSLGEPTVEGELRTNVETEDAFVIIPYYFGDGKSYTLTGSCDIEGLSLESKTMTFEPNGGEVRLAISGIPATTGTATFTLTGLPGESTSVTVTAEVLEGGKGLVLFLETFGPTPDNTSVFNLIGYPTAIGVVSDDIVSFSRFGQPSAEYVRGTDRTNIRHETKMYPKPENYAWASGSPVLHAGKSFQGMLTINNLNLKGATNIKLDFGYISYVATFPKEIVIEYSNDGGATWTQVDWQLTVPYTPGGSTHNYMLAETTEEIIGSEHFSLRLTLNSTLGDSRIDDLRLTGDRL